ncbi:MAG: cation transporter [Anaerolineales bacterium]|nr:cation transporter [Anaerolineales bacterium]
MTTLAQTNTNRFWTHALWLALFTISYNLLEGLVSVFFGISEETLTLFGFGVDSFIEVMSGIGILAMVIRIRQHPDTPRSQFERTALRVTGASFYLLALGLGVSALYNAIVEHTPETTIPGLVISIVSIAVMWALVSGKRKVGRALDSSPILADANCTMVCIYMSLVLLASSLIYELTGVGFVDSIGALGLIWFSYSEGKEAFEKAAGMEVCCDEENCENSEVPAK